MILNNLSVCQSLICASFPVPR